MAFDVLDERSDGAVVAAQHNHGTVRRTRDAGTTNSRRGRALVAALYLDALDVSIPTCRVRSELEITKGFTLQA